MVGDGVAEHKINRPCDWSQKYSRPELADSATFAKLDFQRLSHSTLGAKSITAKTITCQKMMKYQYSAFSKTSLKRLPSCPLSVNIRTISTMVSSQSVNRCAVWKPSNTQTAEL